MSGKNIYRQTLIMHRIQSWIHSVSVNAVEQVKKKAQKSIQYTVKSGDTLWGITAKYLGAGKNYVQIYNDNKDVIESTAKSHGKANSDNGHWIWAGTVLAINIPEE